MANSRCSILLSGTSFRGIRAKSEGSIRLTTRRIISTRSSSTSLVPALNKEEGSFSYTPGYLARKRLKSRLATNQNAEVKRPVIQQLASIVQHIHAA